jgi:type I restriction enzyme S subunit
MEVKPGYKNTEVGELPDSWVVDVLDKFWSVTDCKHVTAHFICSGYPIASIREVQSRYVDLTNAKQTTQQYYNLLIEGGRKPRAGDLIISRNATVGEIAQVAEWHPLFAMGQDVCLLRKREQIYSTEFLQAVFNSSVIVRQLSDAMVGSTFKRINVQQIKNFYVPMPSAPEQRAIAEALSDVDALLNGLKRLIAKKRDLKQATMQQLLTGQTRLPGFSGEWEVKRLGNLGATYGGLTGKAKADFGEGSARYITFMNVMTNIVIDCGTFDRVRISPTETQNRAMRGDLFFNGSSETPEEVAMCAVLLEEVQDVYLNSFCFGFRFREGAEADGVFFAHYFRSREGRELMKSLAQGSTRYNLSKVALLNSSLHLPTLPEQTAIATVLSDMDAEIATLEARRDKTLALKQGMMQEMLTGRTRLV